MWTNAYSYEDIGEFLREARRERGITQVDLLYDDSLFGQDRTPTGVTENNAEHRYYTAISTMAVGGQG